MPPDEKEKLNTLEKLKNKLFSNKYQTKIEYRDALLHKKKIEALDNWVKEKEIPQKVEKLFMKTSVFQKFFIFSVVFFAIAILYVTYMFFLGGNTVSNENIEISIFGNTFTSGGEDLSLQIEILNKNNTELQLVDLVIEYPRGSTGDLSQETERLRESIGTIPAGGTHSENVLVTLFGEQGSIRPIRIAIEYRLEGSNAIFEKEKLHEVAINSTPVNILVDAPTSVIPNQEIVFNVKTSLNSAREAAGPMLLKLDYPVGFEFLSSDPSPSLGNNIWDLEDLQPGEEYDVEIVGKMIDVFDGEEKTFHVFTGSQSRKDKSLIDVVFNSVAHTVSVERPFVEANLYINGIYQREYAASSKTLIRGEVRWENNLNTKVNDLVIKVKLAGNAFNRKTVNAQQGFYNSTEDVITWDKNSLEQLREVEPGEFGAVAFTLNPLSLYSPSLGLLADPTINIEVSISGKQPGEGNIIQAIESTESKIVRIISDTNFNSKALYYSGVFQNEGPIPPKVGSETTYTIVWSISNTSNDISGGQIRSTLPSWIKFVGKSSPQGEDLIYNSSTREILWSVGNIKRGVGVTLPERSVSFQVALTPSLSQVDSSPTLLNQSLFTGQDDFADASVRSEKGALTTSLTEDPEMPFNGARVVE